MSQLAPAAKVPSAVEPFPHFLLLVHLTVLLAVGAFSITEQSPTFFLAAVAGSVLAWLLVDHRGGKPFPRLVINVGVLAAGLNFFYQAYVGDPESVLIDLGHFMILLVIAKLFERKRPRDVGQILGLSLLVVVTGAIFATSAAFGAVVAAFILVALYTLLVQQVRLDTLRAHSDRLLAAGAMRIKGEARASRDLHRVTLVCAAVLALISAAVFLLAPRTGRGQTFLGPWTSPGATFETGYTTTVHLYDEGQLVQSDAVVMEVQIQQDGTNIGSEIYQPYFRGLTFDSYNPVSHQWVHTSRPQEERRYENRSVRDGTIHLGKPGDDPAGLLTQTYTLEHLRDNVLFTLDDPIELDSDQISTVSYSDRDFSILAAYNGRSPLHYTIESMALPRSPDLASPLRAADSSDRDSPFITPGSLGTYRRNFNAPTPAEVPAVIVAEARRILASRKIALPPEGEQVPAAEVKPIADAFVDYLQTTFPYSLSLEAVDRDVDPTADFLLNRKDIGGHCEFFASAMVMLCRSVGINSRIVTGFHGGDYNTLGGFYIVRQLHAHAWTEVYLPNKGWTRYDPSPAAEDHGAGIDSLTRWLREISQIVQQSFLANIISFDSANQANMLRSILTGLRRFATDAGDVLSYMGTGLADVVHGRSNITPGGRALSLGGAVLLVVLAAWLVRHMWRRRTSPFSADFLGHLSWRKQRRVGQELAFFDEFLRLLRKAGAPPERSQTAQEYVDGLGPRLAGAAADANFLVAAFYQRRFGDRPLSAETQVELSAALQRVRGYLNRAD